MGQICGHDCQTEQAEKTHVMKHLKWCVSDCSEAKSRMLTVHTDVSGPFVGLLMYGIECNYDLTKQMLQTGIGLLTMEMKFLTTSEKYRREMSMEVTNATGKRRYNARIMALLVDLNLMSEKLEDTRV